MTISIRSDTVTIDPSQIPLWVSEVIVEQYFQVAIITVLVYHAITTMDKEAKFFWGARLNAVTIVYFTNRYAGIFGAISFLACKYSRWTSEIANYVTIISIDYILVVRVLALYSQSTRHLAWVLKTLLGLEAIIKLILFTYVTKSEDIVIVSLGPEGPTVCGNVNSGPLLAPLGIVDWVIPLVYGIILMTLAIYKAAEFWRLSSGFKGSNLVKVLLIDQAIYFVLAVSCCIFNIMQFKLEVSNDFLATLLEALGSPFFLCILWSIMIFNLKEAGERGLNQGTSYRVNSISDMEFA